jgi:hypothetical protein
MRQLNTTLALPLLWGTLLAPDVTGVWTFDLDPDFAGNLWNPDTLVCTFRQEGQTVTGTCGDNAPVIEGRMEGPTTTWKIDVQDREGTKERVTFVGDLDEPTARMNGIWQLPNRTGKFEARKN